MQTDSVRSLKYGYIVNGLAVHAGKHILVFLSAVSTLKKTSDGFSSSSSLSYLFYSYQLISSVSLSLSLIITVFGRE